MIPHGTPVARVSACWATSASSSPPSASPGTAVRASPSATPSAADDDRPAPIGSVVVIVASRPVTGKPRAASSAATASA